MSKRSLVYLIGILLLSAGILAYFLISRSGPDMDIQGISASTFSVVLPEGITEKNVTELTGLLMRDEVLSDILKSLPEPSLEAIPDIKTIREHLVLRPRVVGGRMVIDIVWMYDKPMRGRFATPEIALQQAIADRIENY